MGCIAITQAEEGGQMVLERSPGVAADRPGYTDVNPPYLFPAYEITMLRAPLQDPVALPDGWLHRLPGPSFSRVPISPRDNDLLTRGGGQPFGQRMVLGGRVLD